MFIQSFDTPSTKSPHVNYCVVCRSNIISTDCYTAVGPIRWSKLPQGSRHIGRSRERLFVGVLVGVGVCWRVGWRVGWLVGLVGRTGWQREAGLAERGLSAKRQKVAISLIVSSISMAKLMQKSCKIYDSC